MSVSTLNIEIEKYLDYGSDCRYDHEKRLLTGRDEGLNQRLGITGRKDTDQVIRMLFDRTGNASENEEWGVLTKEEWEDKRSRIAQFLSQRGVYEAWKGVIWK